METINKIEGLLQKPLWQMTGEEYCQLTTAMSQYTNLRYSITLNDAQLDYLLDECRQQNSKV